jgi:hypothetical protein
MAILEMVKKPLTIRMTLWDGENVGAVHEFTGPDKFRAVPPRASVGGDVAPISAEVWDELHDTWVGLRAGQYVVQGVKGEFYPIDSETLLGSYDARNAHGQAELDRIRAELDRVGAGR